MCTRIRALGLLTVLLLAGCDAGGRRVGAPSLDSLPEWTLAEEVRIGSLDRPNYMLTAVFNITVSDAGRIYAVQGRERLIRVYDSAGAYTATIGRRGQGPGEFESIGPLGILGDTLWVFGSRRLSLWSTDGTLAEEFPLDVEAPLKGFGRGSPAALLPNGEILHSFSTGAEDENGPITPRTLWGRASRQNVLADTLLSITHFREGPLLNAETADGVSVMMFAPNRFRDDQIVVVSAANGRMFIVNRAAATKRDSAVLGIVTVDAVTGVQALREYSYSPTPLEEALIDSVINRWTGNAASNTADYRNGQRLREHMYKPAFVPPVTAALAGWDGTLWLQRGWTDKRWIVIGADGSTLGLVATPPGFTLHTASQTHVWGSAESADGVPQIVRYRLVKP